MNGWASASGRISPDEPSSALRRIPIRDNGEPLVDLLLPGSRLYWVPRHPVFAYERFRLLRAGAAERLARAAEGLPNGWQLAVVEGWRHPEFQRQMHAATRARFQKQHPEWSAQQLSRAANRFSAPMERRAPPPHRGPYLPWAVVRPASAQSTPGTIPGFGPACGNRPRSSATVCSPADSFADHPSDGASGFCRRSTSSSGERVRRANAPGGKTDDGSAALKDGSAFQDRPHDPHRM